MMMGYVWNLVSLHVACKSMDLQDNCQKISGDIESHS